MTPAANRTMKIDSSCCSGLDACQTAAHRVRDGTLQLAGHDERDQDHDAFRM